MDNYIEELINVAKLPFNEAINDIKAIMVGCSVLYLSNYKRLLDYSKEKISLKIKNSRIEILGEDLYLLQINKGEIIIKGIIKSINFGDV